MPYNHEALSCEIDNYIDTVWATVAFVHECRWNENERKVDEAIPFGIGRPMSRSDGDEVTPDAVIQRRPTQGIVSEVKHTFPPEGESERRDDIFRQLKRYDDRLGGWWTETGEIQAHDLVLLTHLTHAVEAIDHLTTLGGSEIGDLDRNLAIVGYFHDDQQQLFFTLKKEYGELLDVELSEKLRRSVPIAARHIEAHQKKFCDSCPPIPYILWLLWTFVLPPNAQNIPRDQSRGYTPIPVAVDELTANLQRYYGYEADNTGNRGIPRSEWIEAALKALVSFRLAHRGQEPASYIIRYKRFYGEDTLERFGRLFYEQEQRRRRRERRRPQLQLFQRER